MDETAQRMAYKGSSGRTKGRRRDTVLLVVNATGVALYLIGTSHAWRISQEVAAGVHSTTGEPFVWALFALPVSIVFGALNLWWGAMIVARRERSSGPAWCLAALIWLTSVIIDFAHH